MDIVTKAKEFASHAHRDHRRNDEAKTPYVFHLEEVASLVRESGGSDSEIAAAWLHDTVEDTETTIEDIRREFGDEVAHIVEGLTDLEEWLSLSLAERKSMQAKRVAQENNSIRRVKLADQTSNVRYVGGGKISFSMDENFVYIEGAKEIALACSGVSDFLDTEFNERFMAAFNNLSAKRDVRAR